MPLPLLFIGVAAATGGLGAGKALKAGVDAAMQSGSIAVPTRSWKHPQHS